MNPCRVDNGYCFEIDFFDDNSQKVEILNFNFTHTEFNNLEEINKTKDDHTTALRRRESRLIIEISPKENIINIQQTRFEIEVKNTTLGLNQGYWYNIRKEKRSLRAAPNQFS